MISYTSFTFFILYFGIMFVLYCALPKKAKWVALLIGSYAFYFVSSKGHILLIILDSLVVWGVGMWLSGLNSKMKQKRKTAESRDEKKKIKKTYNKYSRLVLALGVVVTASALLLSKYNGFFTDIINSAFSLDLKYLGLVQPLGISFFTLEAISYMADVYYGKIEAEKNPLRISLYLSFMLTVVEGPVSRYGQLGEEFKNCKNPDYEHVSKGFLLVLWGLFKKVVIADRAVKLVTAVFSSPEKYGGIAVILAILFYTLQLYCEFSGIMDVMRGLGSMLNLEIAENFRRPFFAKSINEFWQRWHISLGTWLRDYIFYPVSFSKGIKNISQKTRKRCNPYYANLIPTSIALFFVWFTNGFWHGSGWKYIVYGLYYYVLMMLGLFLEPLFRKICSALKINRESKGFSLFRILRTVIIANIGMLIFRADSLKIALEMFKSIFTRFSFSILNVGAKNGFRLGIGDYALILFGFLALFAVGVAEERGIDLKDRIFKLPYPAKILIYLAILFFIIIFGAYGDGYGIVDLIYANF